MQAVTLRKTVVALVLASVARLALGEEYLGREQFLAQAFGVAAPQMKVLWLNAGQRAELQQKSGWTAAGLRLRYWVWNQRSAWILEEIGKDKPITLGVVIEQGRVAAVEVLAFRESRGWEIRYPFFTRQYQGMRLLANARLSREVDGITGATLSVRAVNRVVRAALWLQQFAHETR